MKVITLTLASGKKLHINSINIVQIYEKKFVATNYGGDSEYYYNTIITTNTSDGDNSFSVRETEADIIKMING